VKKFEFRLESVLRYRAQREKEKEISLAALRRLVLEDQRKLVEANVVLDAACEELRRQERSGEIDVAQARQGRLYLHSLRKKVSGILEGMRRLESDLIVCREETLRAMRERKIIEILKARRRAEHVRKIERAEQAELDDVVGRREAVKRSGTQERTP
jgi:flagellar FliJ protein